MNKRIGTLIGDTLLTIAAIGGVICITLVVVAFIAKISIIMFATGSMAPQIPTGSAALVREIPVEQVRIGDVVTVSRQGKLPITHRVVEINGTAGQRELVLRGDANKANDPAPYKVSVVKLVLFSIPGAAAIIGSLGNPLFLGTITLVMTLVVLIVFWPKREHGQNGGRENTPRPRGSGGAHFAAAGRSGTLLGIIALTAGLSGIVTAPAARAVPVVSLASGTAETNATAIGSNPKAATNLDTTNATGDFIRLTASDTSGFSRLTPGETAHWNIEVGTREATAGKLGLKLATAGSANPYLTIEVTSCATAWSATGCKTIQRELLKPTIAATTAASRTHDLGELKLLSKQSKTAAWIRVDVTLSKNSPQGLQSSAKFTVAGFGDEVAINSDGTPSPSINTYQGGEGISGAIGGLWNGLAETGLPMDNYLYIVAVGLILGLLFVVWGKRRKERRGAAHGQHVQLAPAQAIPMASQAVSVTGPAQPATQRTGATRRAAVTPASSRRAVRSAMRATKPLPHRLIPTSTPASSSSVSGLADLVKMKEQEPNQTRRRDRNVLREPDYKSDKQRHKLFNLRSAKGRHQADETANRQQARHGLLKGN